MGFSFRKRGATEEISPASISSDEVVEATGAEALNTLKYFEEQHKLDPNLPIQELNDVDAALATGNAEKGVEIETTLVEENSPYPEVRAAVRNYDVDLPANTIRAWVIGLILCTVGSAVNMLFSLKNPTIQITTYVIQLVSYPIGLGWDLVFPDRQFSIAGVKFNFKPGKFNFKEHVVIVVMSNAAYGGGFLYATDVLIAQQVFYWTVISGYALSPLIPPFYAVANTVAGVFIFFIVLSMGLHFSGHWYADYFVVQSSSAFDNTGAVYDVSKILNSDLIFDEEKYHNYSPLFLSTQFAITYGLSFAAVAAVIVHVILYHGKQIVSQLKLARKQSDDVHMKLMQKYRDAEDWWYLTLFVIMIGLSFAVCTAWPTGFPAWAYVVCILIPLVWTIPIGIIQAIANIQLGLNVLTEFIIGYMLPGHPLAMMMFKNYGYICMSQALYFSQDLKLGHYMKVPPRVMFWSQLVASVWSAIVQIAVMNWALGTIPNICADDQVDNYTCPNGRVFYTASVIWGAIGPRRMFSGDALYASLQWFWLVGAITPIITWFVARRAPKSMFGFARSINMPLVFGGSALDCGLAISTIIIFFTLYLTSAKLPVWYGNYDVFDTLDQTGMAIKSFVAEGETFGPTTWP
ncbi:hypothetical protein ABKA04_007538 [Annulohypoxylon sp. FPYF3050]